MIKLIEIEVDLRDIENDLLGGDDPYSASKGCAELIINSYCESFFKEGPYIASTRAGNVIGGGDWAKDRIIPDAIRAWSKNKSVIIRHPESTDHGSTFWSL